MAQLYVTGPAHIFLGMPTGGGSTNEVVAYLGTCEDSPRVVFRPMTAPVYNSLTGKVPMELPIVGEEAFIGLDLTRWNQPILEVARQRAVASTSAAIAREGTFVPGDYGTLPITENADFTLYMVFPYRAKPAMAAGGLPLGYRFPAANPVGPDDIGPLSTLARKEHLFFHCIPEYIPSTGILLLYDEGVLGLPAIN